MILFFLFVSTLPLKLYSLEPIGNIDRLLLFNVFSTPIVLGFSISLTSSTPEEIEVSSSMSLKLRLSLDGIYSDPESILKSSEEELLLA